MKLKSRKLWVWIVYTGLVIYCLLNNIDNGLIDQYGLVSMIYIGANAGQRYIDKKEKK